MWFAYAARQHGLLDAGLGFPAAPATAASGAIPGKRVGVGAERGARSRLPMWFVYAAVQPGLLDAGFSFLGGLGQFGVAAAPAPITPAFRGAILNKGVGIGVEERSSEPRPRLPVSFAYAARQPGLLDAGLGLPGAPAPAARGAALDKWSRPGGGRKELGERLPMRALCFAECRRYIRAFRIPEHHSVRRFMLGSGQCPCDIGPRTVYQAWRPHA